MIDMNIHTAYASLTCKTSDLVETMKFLKRVITMQISQPCLIY
jgi:hypothetical protein